MGLFNFLKKEEQFSTGGLVDKFDSRDYQWEEIGAAAAPYDWTKEYDVEKELRETINSETFTIPVKDQGASSSCGGQAFSYVDEILSAFERKYFVDKSAKYIYAQTHVPRGGSYGRDNSDILVKQGVSSETILTSYENGNPPSESFITRSIDITEDVRSDAATLKEKSYAYVAINIDSLAQAIKENSGAVILIGGSNNGTWRSEYPVASSIIQWRHFVYCGKVKMIEGKKYIGFINSWGNSIGKNGWQWISEEHFNKGTVLSAWTFVINKQILPDVFTHNFSVDIIYGQRNDEVKALQTALKIDGCFPSAVPATGYYGQITRLAVKKFQFKYSVAPDDELYIVKGMRVGQKTRVKLNELFNK